MCCPDHTCVSENNRDPVMKDMEKLMHCWGFHGWCPVGYGSNLQQVGASVKKHEAISDDILVRQKRFRDLKAMSSPLQQERYWREQEIRDREKAIMERWDQLLELLGVHKNKLERYCTIITLQREIDTLSVTIMALQQELDNSKPGSHLLNVQEKLQKFQLQESQVQYPISRS
jgi:spectrin beta